MKILILFFSISVFFFSCKISLIKGNSTHYFSKSEIRKLVEHSKICQRKNNKKLFVEAKIIDTLGFGLYECYYIPREKSIYGSSTFIRSRSRLIFYSNSAEENKNNILVFINSCGANFNQTELIEIERIFLEGPVIKGRTL